MKILLADDHTMLREGLRAILAKTPGYEIVATVSSGREAVASALRFKPDVVVMDISMKDLNGIEATRQILAELPATQVICLSMHSDRQYVLAMFKAGASGYLIKDSGPAELLLALEAVANQQRYVSPAVAGTLVDSLGKLHLEKSEPLTSREREVLQLLAEGNSSKEIALRLHIAPATVETHRRQIMSKVDLHSVAELTKFAIREGLTSAEK